MSVTATANQPTASSGTITFSWTTTNASSWSVLFQYATTVNGTYTTLSTTTGSASGLQTAAYTTPTTSYYYRTTITAQGTGGPATSTSTSLYYYNPFQGPQGVQGVQGIAGSDGLRGPDGPQGLQGVQGIVNFSGGGGNVANYVITTTNNAGTINANANMTYDGSIFVVTGTGAHKLGPVTFTNGAITSVTNLTGTGTLSMGNVAASGTTAHNLGLVTFTNGAITGVTTLNTITIGSTGNVSGMGTLGCGAITSSGALGLGANTITSGNHVPSANNSYNLGAATTGLWANVYATNLLGVSALNTITLSANNVSGMGTLGCGAITNGASTVNSIGGVSLGNSTLVASTANVEHRLGNVTFNTNTISWAGDGDTGFTFVSDGIFNVVNNNVVMAQFNYNGLDMKTKPISNAGAITATTFVGALTGNCSGSSGSCTGNAATATNVAYSGLTGTVPTWNQNTTGNAATATNVAYSGLTGTVPTWNQNTTGSSGSCTGNSATATNFSGTPNISVGTISSTTHTPAVTNTSDLGSSSLKWANIYATTLASSSITLGGYTSTVSNITPSSTNNNPATVLMKINGMMFLAGVGNGTNTQTITFTSNFTSVPSVVCTCTSATNTTIYVTGATYSNFSIAINGNGYTGSYYNWIAIGVYI